MVKSSKDEKLAKEAKESARPEKKPYMQNRELSWLMFNKRVLDQSIDENQPLLERLKFLAIWRSNLQEFFMVRVGSLLDLELTGDVIYDSKSGMTPTEQLEAIYKRVQELTPLASKDYQTVRHQLEAVGIHQMYPDELSIDEDEQVRSYMEKNVMPLVSPQIVNATHPFPHLENGKMYICVRLDDQAEYSKTKNMSKSERKLLRAQAAENVIMGFIPMPANCPRFVPISSEDGTFKFILLEHALEMVAPDIFDMYPVKMANVVMVTRNADLDAYEESDESDEDFRSHMRRILKKRARLAPVRLESERELSGDTERFLRERLGLKRSQVYNTGMPLDMGFAFALPGIVGGELEEQYSNEPAEPQWPASLTRKRSIMKQVTHKDVILSYPYEAMDPFVRLLQEAANDPDVISIKITLYRLASQSRLAEALITAAENGKDVTALFELRARFDEFNNIEWSQRFEQAGCNIIYGFHDFKVHSKICAITRRTDEGLQFITQLGTGNYNEKTAKLYTDLSMITCDPVIGQDAAKFFRSMQLESVSKDYKKLLVAPLMIKQQLSKFVDEEIEKAKAGQPAEIWLKTNSVTDKDMIEKLAEASQAGVKITMLVRGISCLVPGVEGYTENIRVVSVVGRLLEHSRIYMFGSDPDTRKIYLSSADLMTRNLDKRVEIAWPVEKEDLRARVVGYFDTMLSDTAKLRELLPDGEYTELCHFVPKDEEGNYLERPIDAQDTLIKEAYIANEHSMAGADFDHAVQISTQVSALQEEAEDDYVVVKAAEEKNEAESFRPEPAPETEFEAEQEKVSVEPVASAVEESVVEDSEPEAEPVVEPETEAETEPEAEPVVEPEPEPEPDDEDEGDAAEMYVPKHAAPEPEVEAEAEAQEPVTEATAAEAEAEPQPEPEPASEPEPVAEPEPVVEPEPELEPEPV
uniref:polyphosphate kinase 1 n=1 Tax=Slackia heliotrinireducens TaxID=84110 RepID=UPI003314EDA3